MALVEFLLLLATLVAFAFYYAWNRNQTFKNLGINYLKPHLFFGNMLGVLTGTEHAYDVTAKANKEFPNDKYVGMFNFLDPIVIVQDLDLIKKITVKDFDHFVDHAPFTDEEVDPVLGKTIFALKEDRWKEMRTALSPAFTSSKMRGMFPFVNECAQNMVNFLNQQLDDPSINKLGYVEYNTKDLIIKYSNDAIASCAFGCKVDTLKDEKNIFFTAAKEFIRFSPLAMFKFFVFFLCPFFLKFLPRDTNSSKFFRRLVLESIKTREEKNIIRPDMIHLLMLAKKGSLESDDVDQVDHQPTGVAKKIKFSDDDIVAQALIFLFAGLDSTSTGICGLFHYMAIYPKIQKQLQKEIDEILLESGGKLEYVDLNKFKYLDMVVTESLRMHPPVPLLDRQCVKPYSLPPQNESNDAFISLKRGNNIWIPSYIIHKDPRYYEDADKFIPERFSDENKAKINPYAYIPFGVGPRICIGSRFALMEIKILTIHILSKFDIVTTPKTDLDLKIKPHLFDMQPVKGFWGGIKKRNDIGDV